MAEVTYNTAGVISNVEGALAAEYHDVDIAATGDTIITGLRSVLAWGSTKPASVTVAAFAADTNGNMVATLTTAGAVADVVIWFKGYV